MGKSEEAICMDLGCMDDVHTQEINEEGPNPSAPGELTV
jgi:hypothetical protein